MSEYKYLGTNISSNLDWSKNTLAVQKKANQRLFFIRQLKQIHLDNTLLVLFYKTVIQSILVFNVICFYGNLTNQNRDKMDLVKQLRELLVGNYQYLKICIMINYFLR